MISRRRLRAVHDQLRRASQIPVNTKRTKVFEKPQLLLTLSNVLFGRTKYIGGMRLQKPRNINNKLYVTISCYIVINYSARV